ncbi:hypothetical protein N0V83_009343 [Neocucurbitaria cava]|uniref:Uncharacterized protein n=1 Tax=Neocucurbitaria cava TaxID=798079 RepID=A0A9W8XZD4_9PLEO|nr:hypothetical protein N0V83_009343 [Neocucurbitaria cava]
MNPISRSLFHAVARRAPQITRTPLRRTYATSYDERTQQTLRTSSRLTWLITSVAAVAAGAYFYNNPDTPVPDKIKHNKYSDLESSKPVEDRHGDSVAKHSIAAEKNENKARTGVFGAGKFDNHLQKHSADPSKDFEKVEKK